jgi:hypothetical protein
MLMSEEVIELPVPQWVFGVGTLALLMALLALTLVLGKGRPHA